MNGTTEHAVSRTSDTARRLDHASRSSPASEATPRRVGLFVLVAGVAAASLLSAGCAALVGGAAGAGAGYIAGHAAADED